MSVSIPLDDELAQRLHSQAQARCLSLQQWTLLILRQASEQPGDPQAWTQFNARRLALIQRRYSEGLTAAEEQELVDLQDVADALCEPADRRRLERLAELELQARELLRPSDG
jgi:hypothetical protein